MKKQSKFTSGAAHRPATPQAFCSFFSAISALSAVNKQRAQRCLTMHDGRLDAGDKTLYG